MYLVLLLACFVELLSYRRDFCAARGWLADRFCLPVCHYFVFRVGGYWNGNSDTCRYYIGDLVFVVIYGLGTGASGTLLPIVTA